MTDALLKFHRHIVRCYCANIIAILNALTNIPFICSGCSIEDKFHSLVARLGHFQLGTISMAFVPCLRCPNEQQPGTASWFHFAVSLSCTMKLIGDSGIIAGRKCVVSKNKHHTLLCVFALWSKCGGVAARGVGSQGWSL